MVMSMVVQEEMVDSPLQHNHTMPELVLQLAYSLLQPQLRLEPSKTIRRCGGLEVGARLGWR